MAKKNQNENEMPAQDDADSAESMAQGVESEMGESEAKASDKEVDLSPEDLLEEVRHSLVDAEELKEEAHPKWWQRFGKGSRKSKKEVEAPEPAKPVAEETFAVDDVKTDDQEAYAEQIDDLIEMLDSDVEESPVESSLVVEHVDEVEQKEEEVVDFAEMKKRAFRAATPEEEEELNKVRAVALEGGEEVFVEIETKPEDQAEERWKAFENALMPYRGYITFAALFIGAVAIVVMSYLVYDAYQRSLPTPVVAEVEALPYPTIMYLPGGLNFTLGRGSLDEGRWNPAGPEWLVGTEVCRWVAIPYSRQLEAVVRTLTREDKIELLMSNGDRISYDVFSITQMTLEEMLELDSNSPCLLLVLADAKTDDRWVVTANP